MQQIMPITESPQEYASLGRDYPFPQPACCPYSDCLMPIPLKKHGFYLRYLIDSGFYGKILIRRYYCPYCGRTVSYLPSFCLPYFQYSLVLIYLVISGYFQDELSRNQILAMVRAQYEGLQLEEQQLSFYIHRFLRNLNRIKVGIRQLLPEAVLPEEMQDKNKGTKNMLAIINSGFNDIQTFAQRFFDSCRHSFLSPCKIF